MSQDGQRFFGTDDNSASTSIEARPEAVAVPLEDHLVTVFLALKPLSFYYSELMHHGHICSITVSLIESDFRL